MDSSRAACTGFGACVLALALFCLPVLFPQTVQARDAQSRLVARGDHNYPPYEYLDNGKPTGYNVEVLEAVCRIMGYDLVVDLGPWNEVREDLEQGRIDLITGMYYSPERDKVVDFSTPHIVVTHGVFVRKGSPVHSLEDLKDKHVIVQQGDIMHDYLKESGVTRHIATVQDQIDALETLSRGEQDGALLQKLQGLYLARKHGLDNIISVGPPILPRNYCFAIREGDQDLAAGLNEGLKVLEATGQLDEIHKKWFGVYDQRGPAGVLLKYAYWVGALLGILLVLSFLWSWSLKKRVASRTAALRESEQKFSGLLDRLNEAVYRMKIPEGVYEYCSPAAKKVFGYSAEQLLGNPLLVREIIHPEFRDFFQAEWERLLAGRVAPSYEYKIIDPEGGERWIYQTNTGVFDATGAIIALEGCCNDVTARKAAEAQVRGHLQYMENIARIEKVLAGGSDPETVLPRALDAVQEMFQCDRAYLLHPCDPLASSWKAFSGSSGLPLRKEQGADHAVTPDLAAFFTRMLETKEPVAFELDPEKAGWDPDNVYGVRSNLSMAIFPRVGKPWNFGLHQCQYARRWTGDEINLFRETGHRMAEALSSFLILKNLRESEAMFRAITENTSDIIVILDADHCIAYASPSSARITGHAPERLLGSRVEDYVHENDLENFASTLEMAVRSEGKTMVMRDVRGKKAHGGWVHMEAMVTSMLETDGLNGIVLNCRDVTSRKEAEQEAARLRDLLSNIVHSMPSVLVGVDAQGRVRNWNREAEKTTGVPEKEALDRPLEDVFPLLSMEMGKVREAMATRTPQKDSKLIARILGRTRYVDVTVYPLVSNGSEGAVIRMDDVTDQVMIEEMMIQSEKMLSVGGLAAGMAHEINNPLAGMLQNAEVVIHRLSGDLPANNRAAAQCGITMDAIQAFMEKRGIFVMLENVRRSGIRASQIVENMLAFSRKGDSCFLFQDIPDLMEKTLDLASSDYDLKKSYDFRKIEIEKEYGENIPQVECEATNIQQVLLNLLKNGAQAMSEKEYGPGDGPQFILRIQAEGAAVRIDVEDNGPGMTEEVRKRIFEPFFTTKAVGQGTGLGLSVAYFIVTEKHGGTLHVESWPGWGTRFVIRLPVKRGGEQEGNASLS